MDGILEQLQGLDNVQLRAELLKHGEKVGPVTLTTRKVFLSKLAKKVFATEYPDASVVQDSAVDVNVPGGNIDNKGAQPHDQEASSTDRKSALDKNEDKEDPSAYFVVILSESSAVSQNPAIGQTDHRVFTERLEALAFMKKNAGSRLKVFHSSTDVKHFIAQSAQQSDEPPKCAEPKYKTAEPSSNNLATEAEKSTFKGPKTQELVQFRKLIEKGETDDVKKTVWSNPRYLITGADTPVILHEGMRHNALHIAAKADQVTAATLVLETLLDPEFTRLLYSSSHDTEQSRYQRIVYLVDLYLNSPDKGSGETPLHIACKMGHAAMVRCLVMFSVTDRNRVNKFGERPESIICSRYKGGDSAALKEEIQELLKGLCLVPLLRSRDNITRPVVGLPCSPDDKVKLCAHAASAASPTLSPKEPRLRLSAYAGPMSPSKARDFQKQWMNPCSRRNVADNKEISATRRADAEKGYERIGRKLAKELRVPWTEYWQFLDAFADFSMPDGLHKLERHLRKQKTLLTILQAMETGASDGDTASDAEESEEEDSESFFSCDEGSAGDGNVFGGRGRAAAAVREVDDDVFEDSLDTFFETRGYVFGQRLQLKKSTNNNNDAQPLGQRAKLSDEPAVSISKTQLSGEDGSSSLWSYRESVGSGEHEHEHKASETSVSSNATHSFNTDSPTQDDKSLETGVDAETENCKKDQKQTDANAVPENLDTSFNTKMTELSDDLEIKLIFSPEGKVVPSKSKKGLSAPDIGLCLGRKLYASSLRGARRGACPLDVVVKSRKGSEHFTVDILVHSSSSIAESEDEFSDASFDGLAEGSNQKVLRDVKMVGKSASVLDHVWRLLQPTTLTVGVLPHRAQDVSQHCGCVNARIVRRRRHAAQSMDCYVYGSKPCKTDLDVMRAMCECDVDPTEFPAVHSWLSVVTATNEGKDSWPSPGRLRHQHRLSQLHSHSTASGSPLPISPLVESGTVTSTPVSRSSQPDRRCNRDLSPERPLMTTPRAWLFKSPI